MTKISCIINRLFCDFLDDELHVNIDMFWCKYTYLNHKNSPLIVKKFWIIKDICDGNSHLWHQNYFLPYTKVLGFVPCIVTPEILGIGSAEKYWIDAKTIKSGKRSSIICDE